MPTPYTTEDLTPRLAERKIARDFQERRHVAWDEIYSLYRNKVKTNRLTQRQAVNIPLLKETVKTLLSRVDDPPNVDWQEKSGDEMKEIIYQEMWDDRFKKDKFELKDILDKKYVMLYGLSTKMLNLTDDGVCVDVLDPYDVVFDPTTNPLDINSARFIIRQNIFHSLREILADDRYTKEGRDSLKTWTLGDFGMIQSNQNREEWVKKMERIKNMGVSSSDFPSFAGGDMIVQLCEHYYLKWNGKKFEKRVCVYAEESVVLMDETLKDLIGIEQWPFVVWSEDTQLNDIYTDGIGDLVLTPNKIINIWFSQQAENRTLQNFQMHWYDSTLQGYKPQTYEPGPGVMLPAPGNPNQTIMPVAINGLDETLNSIDWITQVVERGTGATAIEKGTGEKGNQTLGEIQILVGKAMERATTMAKFYKASWYDVAKLWDMMMQNNSFKKTSLYKTSSKGKVYEKVVYGSDWKSQAGYEPSVRSSSEQEQESIKTIQKFMFVMSQFPNNQALRKIAQKRELESLNLTSDELKSIEDAEDQEQTQQPMAQNGQPQDTQNPQEAAQLQQDIQSQLGQLSNLTQ